VKGEILCKGETLGGKISLIFSVLSIQFNKMFLFLVPNTPSLFTEASSGPERNTGMTWTEQFAYEKMVLLKKNN